MFKSNGSTKSKLDKVLVFIRVATNLTNVQTVCTTEGGLKSLCYSGEILGQGLGS